MKEEKFKDTGLSLSICRFIWSAYPAFINITNWKLKYGTDCYCTYLFFIQYNNSVYTTIGHNNQPMNIIPIQQHFVFDSLLKETALLWLDIWRLVSQLLIQREYEAWDSVPSRDRYSYELYETKCLSRVFIVTFLSIHISNIFCL